MRIADADGVEPGVTVVGAPVTVTVGFDVAPERSMPDPMRETPQKPMSVATARNPAMMTITSLDWSRVGAAAVSGGSMGSGGSISSSPWSSASSRETRLRSACASAAARAARFSAALSAAARAKVPTLPAATPATCPAA